MGAVIPPDDKPLPESRGPMLFSHPFPWFLRLLFALAGTLVLTRATVVAEDGTPPEVSDVTIASSQARPEWVCDGGTVQLDFTTSEEGLPTPEAWIAGRAAMVTATGPRTWRASLMVTGDVPEGVLEFSITASDAAGNVSEPVTQTGDFSTVTVDRTPPSLSQPPLITAEATQPGGAMVEYTVSAGDNLDPAPLTQGNPSTGSLFPIATTLVTVTATDGAGNSSQRMFFIKVRDTTRPQASVPPQITVAAGPTGSVALGDLAEKVTCSDEVGVVSVAQNPDAATVLSLGSHPVSFTVSDAAGNATTVESLVTVAFARTAPAKVATGARTGMPAPGEGRPGGPPDGTVLAAFGTPALSAYRDLAAKVTMTSGRTKLAGVYVEDGAGAGRLPAFQGGPVPGVATAGVTFKSFLDPVIAPGGAIAFAATLKGGQAAQDTGVWTDAFGPALEPVLREGGDVPGLPAGSKLKAVQSLSLRDGELLVLLTLAWAPGVASASDDTVLLRMTGASAAGVLLREGENLDGAKVKTMSVLGVAPGSPGHGRWHADAAVVAKVTLADGRVLLVKLAPGAPPALLLSTADAAQPVDENARWKGFALPAVDATGGNFAVAATLASQAGGVGAGDDTVLLHSRDGVSWAVFAREGGAVPMPSGASGPLYASFFDPLINGAGEVAFLATLHGQGVTAKNKTGLWCGATDQLRLLARLGDKVPDENGGETSAVWSRFISYALPGGVGAGAILLAETSGGDTTAKNRLALWAADSTGRLRRLLRTGAPLVLNSPPLKSMALLNAAPGAYGVTRSFNTTGSLALLATFSDSTQALLRIDIP